jgi:Zn-dependent protease with chaperone function
VLQARYFDGQSTRVRKVDLSVLDGDLLVVGEDINLRVPFGQVKVDERLGHAARRLRFGESAFCEVRDLEALDALLSEVGHRDGPVDRIQRHLQLVLVCCVAFVALIAVAYRWGLPWAAARGAQHLPPVIGKTLTVQTLKVLDGAILLPSTLPAERQRALTAKFRALRLPEGGTPRSVLLFRASPQLGANAFTLPDGTIVVLDELVTVIASDPQTLAVFGHELGHAHGHHGLQLLLQSSAVGAFLTLYIGDISHLLAAAPAAVLQARYSKDLEREADDYGAAVMADNGMSPGLLADALEKIAASHPESAKEGYLSSHPSTDARMKHLRELGAAFKSAQGARATAVNPKP